MVAGVVRERLHEPQLADRSVELLQPLVPLEVHVQVAVDLHEPVRLVPGLDVRVVASPGLEAGEPTLPRAALGLLEERRRDPAPLVVGMNGEVPDRPPCPGVANSRLEAVLEVKEPDDLAVLLGDELDRRPLVPLLLPPTSSKNAEPRNESTRQRSQPTSSEASYGRIVNTSATLLRLPATLSVARGA